MAAYAIEFTDEAADDLRRLDGAMRKRILRRINDLGDTPRPGQMTALQGRPGYRIRCGDHRIIYEIDDGRVVVVVVKVGNRSNVYDD